MKHEFNILYRETTCTGLPTQVPVGPVLTVNAIADGPDQLEHQFESCGLFVVGINPVRKVVEWDKPYYNREEAAALLNMEADWFSAIKGDGKMPWIEFKNGLVKREVLEAHLLKHGNAAFKQLKAELDKAA